MRTVLTSLSLIAILTTVATDAAGGPCAIPTIAAFPAFGHGEVVAPDGGVVVTLTPGGFTGKDDASAVMPAWRFVDVSKRLVPVVDDIAPGLAVYRLPAAGGAELALDDGAATPKVLVRVRRSLAPVPALAAPALKKVIRQDVTSTGPRSSSYTQVLADFDGAVPKSAAMVVVYRVDAAGARTPLSWGVVKEGEKSASLYQSGGRCNRSIPGVAPANVGDRIVVAWLDRSGRLSPVSNVVGATAR